MPLITPYYQTTINLELGSCIPEPDVHVTPYKLFCLKTRLQYEVARLNPDAIPQLVMDQQGNRMVWIVKIYKDNVELTLSDKDQSILQRAIDFITSQFPEYCLLLDTTSTSFGFPKGWVMSVVPFLNLRRPLRPDTLPHGYHFSYGIISQTEETIISSSVNLDDPDSR